MGEFILTHLPENPVIGVVSHVKSSSTAQERYQGLCEGLGDEKEHIVGTVYCDSNYEKAYNRTKPFWKSIRTSISWWVSMNTVP